jgi:hypothetical protein
VFKRKLGKMIADDDKTLVTIFTVPFLQRRNYMLAINSAKGPHVYGNHLASQICKA